MAILGGILAILAMLVTFGLQKEHQKQTGVWGPSRAQMRYIRRKARKQGLSEHEAYEDWLRRKQRNAIPPAPTSVEVVLEPKPRREHKGLVLFVLAALAGLIYLISPKTAALPTAIVDRASVNCRADASTSGAIVKTLKRDETVHIADDENGWSKVELGACWIRSDLLRPS